MKGNLSVRVKQNSNSTTIKYDTIQSNEITDRILKFSLKKGKPLQIKSVDEVEYHYKLELETPINGRQIWYAFAPHVDIYDDETGKIIKDIEDIKDNKSPNLDIPYFAQTDNKIRPFQTCNMTSAAMIVEFFNPGNNARVSGQLEDTLTSYCTQNLGGYSSIYYHSNIVKVLQHWGVKSNFSTTTPFTKIKQHLASGNPVIYSGKFTKSGHIIVLRGYDETGFFVNDPYGEWFSYGYKKFPLASGENLHYSYNMMRNLSYSGRYAGWAHLCQKLL